MRNLLITGSGRSGTSMLAGTIDNGVYYLGDQLYGAREANPKGFYENEEINSLNEAIMVRSIRMRIPEVTAKPLLARYQKGQLWLASLPVDMTTSAGEKEKQRIDALTARRPFCFKDPRFSYTLEPWLEAAPDVLVLCIFRAPSATVESILKECRTAPYLFSLDIGVNEAFSVWRQLYWRLLNAARRFPNLRFIRYEDLFEPIRLKRLEELVETKLNLRFPEQRLNRSRSAVPADALSTTLYEVLNALSSADFGVASYENRALIDELESVLFQEPRLVAEAGELLFEPSGHAAKNLVEHYYAVVAQNLIVEHDRAKLREYEMQLNAYEARLTSLKAQLDSVQANLDGVYNSLTWRLAAPLRWMRHQSRRVKGIVS